MLEESFGWRNAESFRQTWKRKGIVVQGPGVFHLAAEAGQAEGSAVILTVRHLDEIRESREHRMVTQKGKVLSGMEQNLAECKSLGIHQGVDAAAYKYRVWRTVKAQIQCGYEVRYDDLVTHPLWVDEEVRRREGAKWHHRRVLHT